MAEAVLEVLSESGHLQITGTGGIGYGLSHTGNLSLVNDGATHPQPMVVGSVTVTGVNPVFAFKGSGRICVERTTVNGGQFTFNLRAQSNVPIGVQWWVFDTAATSVKDPTMAGIAAEFYDEFGVMTFDATMAAMRVADAIETPKTPNDIPFGAWSSLEDTTTIPVPPGKVYAIAQTTPAFVMTTYDTGSYGTGQYPPELNIGDGEPPLNGTWRYQNLESYQATGGYTGADTISVGLTRFEYWPGWNSWDSTPFINVWGQARHMIIDVTNFTSAGGISPTVVTGGVNATTRSVSTGGSATISQSTTPAVTVTASGGTAPYTYLWQFVSGNDQVLGAGSYAQTTFSTTTLNQPAGTTRSAVYRCRITDANGFVGFSPDVTFEHVAQTYSVDVTPDGTTWGPITINTNEPSGWFGTTSAITGINQPITLRVERYDYTGGLSACQVHVYRGPSSNGPWTPLGSFDVLGGGLQYYDATFTNGEFLHYAIEASTAERRRTGQFRVVVHNLTASTQISNQWNYVTVDADDNFTVADYDLAPVSWDNIAASTSANDLSTANAYRTLSGINRNVTLRATISGLSGGLSAGSRLEMYVGGAQRYHSTNLGNGSWAGGDFAPGEQIAFVAKAVSTDGAARSGVYTVTVTNVTTGATVSSFTVNQSVAGADYTPDVISFPTFSVASNYPDASWTSTSYGTHTISGINRPITIRFERYGYSGDLSALHIDCFTMAPGATDWTHHGYFSAHEGGARYLDVAGVVNGTKVAMNPHAISASGRREGQCQLVIWALTNGSNQFVTTGTNTFVVDADNNYIPADYTPNPLTLNDISLFTNDPSGWTNDCQFQVSGINQTITLRFTRGNQVDSGGIFTRRLFIYHSTNGGASWSENFVGTGANTFADIAVNSGDIIIMRAYCDTNAGRGDTSFTAYITNLTTGASLGALNVYGTVDADNNHNVVGPPTVALDNHYFDQWEYADQGQNHTVYVGRTNITIAGGQAPFQYQWERQGGLSGWSVGSYTTYADFYYSGTTNFSDSANYRLKITDALNRVAYSDWVSVTAAAGNIQN